jgi:hypothetical protein
MKKKRIRQFLGLFDSLTKAGEIMAGYFEENPEALENAKSTVSQAYSMNQAILDDPSDEFMIRLFDEIDNNLYDFPHSRPEYFKDILRGFSDIVHFLDYQSDIELVDDPGYTHRIGEMYFAGHFGAVLMFLNGYQMNENAREDDLPVPEKYILSCYMLMLFFANSLDSRCLHFGFDLAEFQRELGIFILRERNLAGLAQAGYLDKVKEIISREESLQKALPAPGTSGAFAAKTFTDWLHHDDPPALASLCSAVFNESRSPKAYAAMFCLLQERRFIHVAKNHRRVFYESWYRFIGRPFPAGGNYSAINKFIDYRHGFQFLDDTDADYVNLEMKFNRELANL